MVLIQCTYCKFSKASLSSFLFFCFFHLRFSGQGQGGCALSYDAETVSLLRSLVFLLADQLASSWPFFVDLIRHPGQEGCFPI